MRVWGGVLLAVALALGGWAGHRLWPRSLVVHPGKSLAPAVEAQAGATAVRLSTRRLLADAGQYDDELFACLMFDWVRGMVAPQGAEALLTYQKGEQGLVYTLRLHLPDDLLTALPHLAYWQAAGILPEFEWRWVTAEALAFCRSQAQRMQDAYNLSARRELEGLDREELVAYLRRFIRFKSLTDRRVRRKLEPAAQALSEEDAHRLSSDIVTVADFFSLPLDFFLGIGAMENNYLNVQGDLGHAVWKRRAQKGDVVLRRGRRGVLVLNESSGIWQITRETLRYAHRLYEKGQRDYSRLPEHLRPPQELNLAEVPSEVLATYAGLLFRDLLDRFQGDVALAVAAYNGGPGRPNPKYAASVEVVAQHARRVLEHAAVLNGRPAAGVSFLARGRSRFPSGR